MTKFSFLFLIVTVLFSAQNQRFTYEYKFISDSNDINKVQTEIMDLDISSKGSKFCSSNKKIADSIIEERNKNPSGNVDYSGIKFGKVAEVVEKIYPDFNVYLFQNLDSDTYKVEDDRDITWAILPEKEKIGNWDTQKATTKMYGRTWTAWFATAIPFQDGPYKFHGLPGLIVKISDQSNSHIFELKEVKNLGSAEEWESYGRKNNYSKPIALNQEKFKKVHQNFRKDPIAGMRQMMSRSGVTIIFQDAKGNKLDPKEQMIKQEKQMKESFIKNNNLLELDLLK